jgi:NAD-dependent dihydropyrimidine dehydrogenase PreA subunit
MAISIDKDSCIGCAACIDSCPLELISLEDDVAVITDEDSCIECGACVDSCAVGAISL